MCKADVVYLLIAPMKERIVREATVHTILYDHNSVYALIPSWDDDDISTLKLNLWIPTIEDICQISEGCFTEANFDVFKIAWDGLPGIWSPSEDGEEPDEDMKARLNNIASMAVQIMEEQGIHGFVYCSQGYSEHQKKLPLSNSLIIGAINPYKAAKNRILLSRGVSISDADKFDIGAINMLDIIPELSNKSKDINQETSYISFLDMSWSNIITAIGFRLVKILTTSIDRDHIETSYGGFDWETYQTILLEDSLCYNFDIFLTGLLRELFLEYSVLDWEYMKSNGSEEHPIYDHGDFPNELVDIIHSQFYVREFIRRLQNPYYRWEDWC